MYTPRTRPYNARSLASKTRARDRNYEQCCDVLEKWQDWHIKEIYGFVETTLDEEVIGQTRDLFACIQYGCMI